MFWRGWESFLAKFSLGRCKIGGLCRVSRYKWGLDVPVLILHQNATQGPYLWPLGVVAGFRVWNRHQKVIFRRTFDWDNWLVGGRPNRTCLKLLKMCWNCLLAVWVSSSIDGLDTWQSAVQVPNYFAWSAIWTFDWLLFTWELLWTYSSFCQPLYHFT